jgi:hypothetical protein
MELLNMNLQDVVETLIICQTPKLEILRGIADVHLVCHFSQTW